MIKLLKILTFLLAIALLVPLLGLIVYDLVEVRPHLDEIHAMLDQADPEDRNPRPLLVDLLRAEDPSKVRYSMVQTLVWKFYGTQRTSNLGRHARGLLWTFFLWLHFSQEERDGLYCSQMYMGNEQIGFSVVAKELYDRPLSELTLEELATLAVIPRQPATLRKRPEKRETMRDWLLARYYAAQTAQGGESK